MTQADYDAFLERAIPEYAADKVRVGNCPAEGALERSRTEFLGILPTGTATPNHHLWMIEDTTSPTYHFKSLEIQSESTFALPDIRIFGKSKAIRVLLT
jgi:hypothetical protein